jgi:hypothetical protein
MDEVDIMALDKVNEPVAALRKVNYSVRHPFEAIVALYKGYVFELADGVTLSLMRPRPHYGQYEPDFRQGPAQAHRIGPDPPDRIRRH